MKIHGLPEKFWIVTAPTLTSTFGDICFECSFKKFAAQIRGGLTEHEIKGFFANQADASDLANELLEREKEFRKTPGFGIHKAPWPNWYATQEPSNRGVVIIRNRLTDEELIVRPPREFGHSWGWNISEDGTGIVIRQTA